jgi:MFS family permease
MLSIQKKLSNSFYAILSLPATAMGFALCIQISALSWILSTQYHLKIDEIGLVWAAGPIAGILGQVIIGVISDKVWLWGGRRRPFILIGGIFAALMLLALPNIQFIATAFGFKSILGVAIAVALTLDLAINVSFNPTRSIIADVTPEGDARTKGYTWMQTVSGTFGVLAYFIGAKLNNYVLIYSGVFFVLLLGILPSFFIEEPKELAANTSEKKSAEVKTPFLDILKLIEPLWGFLLYAIYGITAKIVGFHMTSFLLNESIKSFLVKYNIHFVIFIYLPEIACFIVTAIFVLKCLLARSNSQNTAEQGIITYKKILAAHSFTWIGVQTMFVYLFAYLQCKVFNQAANATLSDKLNTQLGQVISYSFLIFNAVAAILPALILEPITHKIGRVRTHMICIFSMAASYALMLFFGFTPMAIYIIMALLGIGWASTISLPFAIMSQQIDQSRMGLFMGLFNLSVVLPQLVASLGIAQVINAAPNKSIIFIISTICLAISGFLWTLVKEEKTAATPAVQTSGH